MEQASRGRERAMTIRGACAAFLDETLRIRNLHKNTLAGYGTAFQSLLQWAERHGLASLQDCDETRIRAWVEGWQIQPSTARMRLSQLKSLFGFAVERGWLSRSPLASVRAPRGGESPASNPLTAAEMGALLAACEQRPKERALVLLMRYSGLAIGDAVTLSRKSLAGAELTLHRAKGGEPVTVELPLLVVESMRGLRGPSPDYYWWTGRSEPVTCAKYWRTRLGRVAKRAGIEGFRPQRLRDTFAVSQLAAGVFMEDLSELLGHSSVGTTERHYAPWSRRRPDRLARALREMHRADPLQQRLDTAAVPPAGRTRESS